MIRLRSHACRVALILAIVGTLGIGCGRYGRPVRPAPAEPASRAAFAPEDAVRAPFFMTAEGAPPSPLGAGSGVRPR